MPKGVVCQPNGAFGQDHGLIHEVVVTGRKVGAGRKFWEKLAHNEGRFRACVKFVEGDSKTIPVPSPVIEIPFFANEERSSSFGYLESGYIAKPKPICEQLLTLSRYFPHLDSVPALEFSRKLPECPVNAEGPFVVPRWSRVADTYHEAVATVLGKIDNSRGFLNDCKSKFSPQYPRQCERTKDAEQMLVARDRIRDFLIFWAQFGLMHRGRSTNRVRAIYTHNEFGLGAFAVGSMLLTHPERLMQEGYLVQLDIDCPGDEYIAPDDRSFKPCFDLSFDGTRLRFSMLGAHGCWPKAASATAFIPNLHVNS